MIDSEVYYEDYIQKEHQEYHQNPTWSLEKEELNKSPSSCNIWHRFTDRSSLATRPAAHSR